MKEILTSFEKALARFGEALREPKTTISRDAAIQRFEFVIELAWKCVQKFLRQEEILCRSPKECLREAFKFGLVRDDPRWVEAFEDRNLTAHTYDEATADAVYGRLPRYRELFEELLTSLRVQKD